MIKIESELKLFGFDEDGDPDTADYIIINGIADKESFYINGKHPSARLFNEDVIKLLKSYTFHEVGQHLSQFSYQLQTVDWFEPLHIRIYCNNFYDHSFPKIELDISINNWENWVKPWSIADLANTFKSIVDDLGDPNINFYLEDGISLSNGFGIEYLLGDPHQCIDEKTSELLTIFKVIAEKTCKSLAESIDENSLVTFFHFPSEIKSACSQYLIYFAQFLADLGINVDTELKEETHQTLFKVTPKNEAESLDKIREALDIYLKAASNKELKTQIAQESNVATGHWMANIRFLESQLALANATLQAKDATIEALQITNFQYKQEVEKRSKDEDSEEIIKDVVSLGKFEVKGVSVNLAELLRRLKRRF